MYCEDNQGTDIDHFEPIDRAPERTFEWHNYFLACSHCNSNLKRELFPVDNMGNPLLINPCSDDPSEHFQLFIHSAQYGALSEKGIQSIKVFGLNERELLVKGRKAALVTSSILICKYAEERARNTPASTQAASAILETLMGESFATVISTIVDMFKNRSQLLDTSLTDAIGRYPELLNLT